MNLAIWLLLIAVLVNGLLVGASMDQSIKQLPARHRIGVVAYSEYSKAADLCNGVVFYGVLGIGGALVAIAAAVVGLLNPSSGQVATALWVVIVLTLAHSAVTGRAAPTNFKQRNVGEDEARLTAVFGSFVKLQTIRMSLQLLTLLALAWGLAAQILHT